MSEIVRRQEDEGCCQQCMKLSADRRMRQYCCLQYQKLYADRRTRVVIAVVSDVCSCLQTGRGLLLCAMSADGRMRLCCCPQCLQTGGRGLLLCAISELVCRQKCEALLLSAMSEVVCRQEDDGCYCCCQQCMKLSADRRMRVCCLFHSQYSSCHPDRKKNGGILFVLDSALQNITRVQCNLEIQN